MRAIKKMMLLTAILTCTAAQAQVEDYGIFKHIGADINVGTQGIGFDVATPITNYLEMSMGMNFMPGFKISGDVDVSDIHFIHGGQQYTIPMDQVNIEGKLARTTAELKFSAYPFGVRNSLFVAAGFSFAGKKIAKLKGHSDDVKAFMNNPEYPDDVKQSVYAEIDKYEVKFNSNGDINGDVRVNALRPYLGLGYGRLVPKKRLGFRVELGCQFMGKMKIYQDDKKVDTNDLQEKGDDDLSKFIDKFTVYPVLKISFTGRIL